MKDYQKYFCSENFEEVKEIINNLQSEAFETVLTVKWKNPIVITIVSVLFGLIGGDRFMLGDGVLGLIKFITSGGFFIWWMVDILTAAKRAKQWNINRLRALANGCVTSSSKEK